MIFAIHMRDEYIQWYRGLESVDQAQIERRLLKIRYHGYFGHIRHLQMGLCELKFRNGFRVYFFRSAEFEITLIYGGTKHGQKKDIEKAKKLFNI